MSFFAFRTWCLSLACLLLSSSHGQTRLFNNATKGGLTDEGLKTRPRPGGGWYSEVQPGNGASGFSFRQWTFRLGDDFAVPSGGWRLTSVTVFGFQDNAQSPTVNVGALEIRRGSVTGEVVLTGGAPTSKWTDIYRIFNGMPDDVRRVQAVTYPVSGYLPPGYYWLVYSANGNMGISGPWSPPLTKVGSLTVPAANCMGRQSTWTLQWVQLFDVQSGQPQDLPFWIDGYQLPSRVNPDDQQIQGPPPATLSWFPFISSSWTFTKGLPRSV